MTRIIKDPKKYKKVIDNKMRSFGDVSYEKKVVRINKKKSKKDGRTRPINKGANKYPEVLDTIYHEERHIKHPKEHEKTVRKKTGAAMKTLTAKQKEKIYNRYKNK